MIRNEKLLLFENHRDFLIDKLETKEIDKAEFVVENYNFFIQSDLKPYKKISTIEEGLYNYQYYNTLAKYDKMKAKELKYTDPFVSVDFKKQGDKYYFEKERVTEKLIDLYGNNKIDAYYIQVTSKSLKGKLFEIVFVDLDRVILHSMDRKILRMLKNRKSFHKQIKKSIIDEYINSLYWCIGVSN